MFGYFYDILGEWQDLVSYIDNPKFIEALNIHHWWNFKEETGNKYPMIMTSNIKDITDDNTPHDYILDSEYIKNKVKICDKYSPYWYCVPGDCVELNSIVMGTLISLYLNKSKEELYYVSLYPPHSPIDYHIVIINKYVNIGDKILFDKDNMKVGKESLSSDKLIIYDFIYPLMTFFGKTWVSNERQNHLDLLEVSSCTTLEQNFISMNFNLYYKK